MPGPVSDSYDPEFSTRSNAHDVTRAISDAVARLECGVLRGKPVKHIVEVVHGKSGPLHAVTLSEREWRVIRFALNRALESI